MPPVTNDRPPAAWSPMDDELLKQARAQNMNWAPIATKYFPHKTPNACRKRHERLMEKKNAENCDGVKFEELARAYVECREQMWKILGDKVGEKWQHVETKCMEKGLKTIISAARPRRAKASTSPTSPLPSEHDHDPDPDFDDSGLGPDGPGSSPHGGGNGSGNIGSGGLNPEPLRHQRQHSSQHSSGQPSHHGSSLQSTPGASYASLQSGYSEPPPPTAAAAAAANYPSNYLPTLQHQQAHHPHPYHPHASRLPSFSSGFGEQQMPGLAQIFAGPGAPISASY
ncbi:hypothetical protein MMC26_003101 [Xylographa opegraphella]|nr:hypothetical protein [Xylographa opegraphella]